MALATQCPHCQTTFRVANDQLKLRGGLVRCGSCREVFNGIEHLVRPDVAAPVPAPATAPEQDAVTIQTHGFGADEAPLAEPQHSAPPPPVYVAPEPTPIPGPTPEPEPAVAVATDHPLPVIAAAAAPETTGRSMASGRVEAAIDGLEEDLRIAEETSQSAPADVHHTPFGLIKPSASTDPDEAASNPPTPNVWHRHADDDEDKQIRRA